MSMTTHRAFLGDDEHDFRLTPTLILELERKTEAGIGELCKRLFEGRFKFEDIAQVIRLALIGGGMSPENAALHVKTYVVERPLQETLPLAIDVLSALWFGSAQPAKEPEAQA